MSLISVASKVREELLSQPRFLLALHLTAIFLIIRPYKVGGEPDFCNLLIAVLCILLVLSRILLVSKWTWLFVCLSMIAVLVGNWQTMDNHKYLIAYWALSCCIAVATDRPDEYLSRNARLLIGLSFGAAVLWKFLPGEFLDGSFFHALFLTDFRVRSLVLAVGGVDAESMEKNAHLMRMLQVFPGANLSVTLHSSDRLHAIACITSYWVILIEGSVAVTFLSSFSKRLSAWRDPILVAFICTTYLIAPVDRFPSVLSIMGYAQCDTEKRALRSTYLSIFVIMQFTRLVPSLNRFFVNLF